MVINTNCGLCEDKLNSTVHRRFSFYANAKNIKDLGFSSRVKMHFAQTAYDIYISLYKS